MNKIIPALLLLFNASVALAQSEPAEESASNMSSQRLVVEALNFSASHPQAPLVSQTPTQSSPETVSGIGPSSNMTQPGDYGYSPWSDLRQLNF